MSLSSIYRDRSCQNQLIEEYDLFDEVDNLIHDTLVSCPESLIDLLLGNAVIEPIKKLFVEILEETHEKFKLHRIVDYVRNHINQDELIDKLNLEDEVEELIQDELECDEERIVQYLLDGMCDENEYSASELVLVTENTVSTFEELKVALPALLGRFTQCMLGLSPEGFHLVPKALYEAFKHLPYSEMTLLFDSWIEQTNTKYVW